MNQEILKKLNELKRIGGITKEEILQAVETMFPREKVLDCYCGATPRIESLTDLGTISKKTLYEVVCCQEKSCGNKSRYFHSEEKTIEDWNESIKETVKNNIECFKSLLKEQQELSAEFASRLDTPIALEYLQYPLKESAYLNFAMLENGVINVPLDDSLHEVDDKK